jgi:hypothetical protein
VKCHNQQELFSLPIGEGNVYCRNMTASTNVVRVVTNNVLALEADSSVVEAESVVVPEAVGEVAPLVVPPVVLGMIITTIESPIIIRH